MRSRSLCAWLLLAASLCVGRLAAGQMCNSSRSLTSRSFGFLKAESQGTNESYAYLVLLLNVGSAGADLSCSTSSLTNGDFLLAMQKAEAALWAVDTFQRRMPSLLPGATVGALLLDGCQSSVLSAQQLGNLQTCETSFGAASGRVQPDRAVAIVGVDSLAEAADVLPVLRSAGKPGVAYELTAGAYDASSYPLLARVSPSDSTEAEALAALVAELGARHAQIVYSADRQGRYAAMAAELQRRLSTRGVCVANKVAFSGSAAASVNSFATVRPVLLLLTAPDLASFSTVMLSLRPSNGVFTWLFASEWSRSLAEVVAGRENFFAGALTLVPSASAAGYSDYQTYFKGLNPAASGQAERNPWMSDFWPRYFRCNPPNSTMTTYTRTCNYADATQNLQTVSSFDAASAKVIQAVDLLLNALHLTVRQLCPSSPTGLCSAFASSPGRFQSLYANMYNGSSGGAVALTPDGGPANYTLLVRSLQKTYPGHAWTSVGSYQSGMLRLASTPQAYNADERNTTWTTSCDAACQAKCAANASTTTTAAASLTTGAGAPGSLRRQDWVYALIVCASVGIIVCLVFIFFIIKTVLELPDELKTFNTLWSGQVLLFIILIGYVTLFAWVPWPTAEACGVIRFMVGFVYAAMFSILLVKLLNLMNSFLAPEYQLLLFCLALAVQVATAIEWLVLVPVSVTATASGSQCGHSFLDHLQTLVYCMLLIVICTVLAVRAHSIGKNNREAIFIGCAAGISIPIWITWSLIGSLSSGRDFEDASMAFGLFVNLTLVLLVIFLPKINQLRKLRDDDDYVDDEENDEPIYVLTQGAPSVRSEGPVYVTAAPGEVNAAFLAVPTLHSGSSLRVRSLSGGVPLSAVNTLTRTQDLRGTSYYKAYSDYNVGAARQSSREAPSKLASLPEEAKKSKEAARRQELEQLGYL